MSKVPSNVFSLDSIVEFNYLCLSVAYNDTHCTCSFKSAAQTTDFNQRILAYIQGTALPGRTISAQKLASLFLGNLCFSFFAFAKIAPIDVLYC